MGTEILATGAPDSHFKLCMSNCVSSLSCSAVNFATSHTVTRPTRMNPDSLNDLINNRFLVFLKQRWKLWKRFLELGWFHTATVKSIQFRAAFLLYLSPLYLAEPKSQETGRKRFVFIVSYSGEPMVASRNGDRLSWLSVCRDFLPYHQGRQG